MPHPCEKMFAPSQLWTERRKNIVIHLQNPLNPHLCHRVTGANSAPVGARRGTLLMGHKSFEAPIHTQGLFGDTNNIPIHL